MKLNCNPTTTFGRYINEKMDKERKAGLDRVVEDLLRRDKNISMGEYAMLLAKNGFSISKMTEEDYRYIESKGVKLEYTYAQH